MTDPINPDHYRRFPVEVIETSASWGVEVSPSGVGFIRVEGLRKEATNE